MLGLAGIAGALTRVTQLSGVLLAVLLLFPTLGMAAAPFNSWAAQRATLPVWLRERRQTEYRRDRRAFAAGAATGGVVAVLGVVAAAMFLFLAPGGQRVHTPDLVGPAQGQTPAAIPDATPSSRAPATPAGSSSPSPSASPAGTPTTAPPASPSPSVSVTATLSSTPTPSVPATATP